MEAHKNGKLGLALSGGGYRAAAFHLGTLRKLHQLDLLSRVEVISTVSGGSIIGAAYVLASKDENFSFAQFEKEFIAKLKQSVVRGVILSPPFILLTISCLTWVVLITYFQFTPYPYISWVLALLGVALFVKKQFAILPVSKIIEQVYDAIFFQSKTLNQLPNYPQLAINSTNLETGRQFTFSRSHLKNSKMSLEAEEKLL